MLYRFVEKEKDRNKILHWLPNEQMKVQQKTKKYEF
jgi:hypothetical protein